MRHVLPKTVSNFCNNLTGCMPALELPEKVFTLADQAPLTFVELGYGRTTLLIHGSLCDYRYWRWQMAPLAEYGRVIAPSLRGFWPHTCIAPDPRFSVQQHAADLVALIRATSPDEPVDIVGHSRGAHVALEMAVQAPALVRSMVLADPGMNVPGVSRNSGFINSAAQSVAQGLTEAGLETFIDTVSGPDTWRRMTGWFKTMVRDNAGTLLSQALEADTLYDPDAARQISCPVLLLGGSNSPQRYRQIIDVLAPRLADARRDTVPMASHGMNLANPKSFNRKVLAFFAGEQTALPA